MSKYFTLKIKIVIVGAFGVVLLLGTVAPTQATTIEDLLAQIAALQDQIKALQDQLADILGEKPAYEGIPAGFVFENNLKYGMKNNEVKYLQIILKVEVGPPTYPEKVAATGWFGPITKFSVIKFQEKYATDILEKWCTNNGYAAICLPNGTGFVGSTTRDKLNDLLTIPGEQEEEEECLDDTLYDQCSTDKPKYCDEGILINKCSVCGCSDDNVCQENESCQAAPGPQCTSGLCCDLADQIFKTSTEKCLKKVETEYNCPWGNDPGDDVGVRYQDRYCSGNSANCDGSLEWGDWSLYDNCTLSESCLGGVCAALTCSDGTSYGQCSTEKPRYCDDGELINKCSVCSCPSGKECREDGDCVSPTLSVFLSADPSAGNPPLLSGVDLTAEVYGSATGRMNYIFYCNRSDSGTDVIPGYDQRIDFVLTNPYTVSDLCDYPSGNYTAKVIVERSGLAVEDRTTINVASAQFDFNLSISPSSGTVTQGSSISTIVTATLISDPTQSISFSASGLPSGATASFSPTSCNPTCSSALTISTLSTTPTGTYQITITGTGGGLNKTTTYFLAVEAPSPVVSTPTVSTNPATSITGTNATLNGNLTNTGGQNADLRGFDWGTSPGSYPNSWTEGTSGNYQYGTGTFIHLIPGLSPGTTYYFRAKAHNSAGWGYGSELSFTTVNFSLSIYPTSGSVVPGYKPISATLSVFSNSSQTVSFSASGLPSGASASFSPSSCLPTPGLGILASSGVSLLAGEPIWTHSCYSTLIINAASTTPTGTYSITITGTGGGLTKTTTFSLTVEAPTLSVSLSANPSLGYDSLNKVDLTAQIPGTATGPIDYTFYCNRSDSGTNITPDYDYKIDDTTDDPFTVANLCDYPTVGTYTAKVIAEKGDLIAEDRATINVFSPTTYPIQVPVLVLNYFPTKDGVHLDRDITGIPEPWLPEKTLDWMRNYTETLNSQLIQALETGSTYHEYKDSSATPALDYGIYEVREFLQPVPSEETWRKIIDRDPETGSWRPSQPFADDYLSIDLRVLKQIDSISLYFRSTYRPEQFHIDASSTGEFAGEEQRVVTELNGLGGYSPISPTSDIEKKEYTFGSIDTRYIKLVVDSYRVGQPDTGWIDFYEFGISYDGVDLDISDADASAPEGLSDPADHIKILNDVNICNYVENLLVKEVWIWMYHTTKIYPVESYQRGPYGGVGNGYMDLPLCQKTYTVYDYNYQRGLGEALEDHTHHIERIFDYVDRNLWWENINSFTGGASEFRPNNLGLPLRCGWTHCPPNVIISPNQCGVNPDYPQSCMCEGYNWFSERTVLSGCEDWRPDGSGEKTSVNCHTWSDSPDCRDYTDPFKDGNVGFKIWWMQNIPGKSNGLTYDGKMMRNWWDFVGDFDQAMQVGRSLTY